MYGVAHECGLGDGLHELGTAPCLETSEELDRAVANAVGR